MEPFAQNNRSGGCPSCAPERGAQLVRGAVGVAVQWRRAELGEPAIDELGRRRVRALVGVEPHRRRRAAASGSPRARGGRRAAGDQRRPRCRSSGVLDERRRTAECDAPAVGREAFGGRERLDVFGNRRRGPRARPGRRGCACGTCRRASALGEARGARGGEHVVDPGDVVADRRRRPRADEHRARVADQWHEQRRRRPSSARGARARSGSRRPSPAPDRRRSACDRRTRSVASMSARRPAVGNQTRRARRRPRRRRRGPSDEHGGAARAVLGLREEIGGDELGGALPSATTTTSDGPASAVDADDAGDLALGGGDVRVAGPDDDVDRAGWSRCRRRARRWPGRRRPGTPRRCPTSAAAARVASGTRPSGPGGTHRTISGTPATCAGIAVINTVDGYDGATAGHVEAGAVDRARDLLELDPGALAVRARAGAGARGRRGSRRPRTRAQRGRPARARRSAASSSAAGTRRSSTRQPSKRSVSSRSAASPRARTSAMMARTAAVTSSSVAGGCKRAARSEAPRRSRRLSTVRSW